MTLKQKIKRSILIQFLKGQRLKLKHFWHQLLLKHQDFSIISNNCWGTHVYKKYGLQYRSPFQSLFIFAPDYINLITDFSITKLEIIKFIEISDSKYFSKVKEEYLNKTYPIGILRDGTELHFLHYKTAEDAKEKWDRRVKKINENKLIFKFSEEYLSDEDLINKFNNLPYANKLCFTAKPYPELESVVYISQFKNDKETYLEWKYDSKYINLHKFFNNIKENKVI